MEQLLHKALGMEIRNRREELKNLTQEDLSRRTKVSRATIANIELGRQSVTVNVLYKLSRGLEIDAGALLNRAVHRAYPEVDKSIHLSDVDNKPEVLDTLNKYIQ